MRNIKSKNTKPEILLRKALHALGVRYRIHGKDIIGKPDIYIKKYKLAVFADSEFWHGKLYKEGTSIPQINKEYWIPKLERNISRDIEVNKQLKQDGWKVLRFWEKDIRKNPNKIAEKIYLF